MSSMTITFVTCSFINYSCSFTRPLPSQCRVEDIGKNRRHSTLQQNVLQNSGYSTVSWNTSFHSRPRSALSRLPPGCILNAGATRESGTLLYSALTSPPLIVPDNYNDDGDINNDDDARSQFGTRRYWDDMYSGMGGDFSAEEYTWYYGWEVVKQYWTTFVPTREAPKILVPGVGNDPMLLDLVNAGYADVTALDYSMHAIERQKEILSYQPDALEHVTLRVMDARSLDKTWSGAFDAILEKGLLDALYLAGDGNVERAAGEMKRVIRPGGMCLSVSGVVPSELRKQVFDTESWEWVRDGSEDLKAGLFIFKRL